MDVRNASRGRGWRSPDLDDSDEGFSLVELLVVIAILGILAAIAVPVLMSQRERAGDATLKSDLRLVAGAAEALRTEGDPLTQDAMRKGLRLTAGTEVEVHEGGGGYCLTGERTSGPRASQVWVYRSDGGLQDSTVTSCAGAVSFVLP